MSAEPSSPAARSSARARIPRRACLTWAAALAASAVPLTMRAPAWATGRLPVGGRIALHLPWPIATLDPHRIDDAAAALLGDALFDGLYALDAAGAVVPVLAESDPEADRGSLRIVLRAGLRSALDRPIEARDVVQSVARARASGARGWLAEIPPPREAGKGAIVFATRDAAALTRALASPLVAVVPASFNPGAPDGTGPFRAERRGEALVLVRNPRAARGPAFLDEIAVRASADLAGSLRAFEAGADDVGWLGSGLHEPRAGARTFDAGAVAWAVLRTGKEAGAWDAPGIAQRIADGLPPSRLAYLVLGPPWRTDPEEGWGGGACDLIVRDDAPWLIELARAVAATIARPLHPVGVRPVSPAELAQRRASRAFALAVDVVRPLAPTALGAFVALATADDPSSVVDVARHAPRLGAVFNVRALPRTMRLGVLGEIRAQGARMADLSVATSPSGGLDLGAITRARRAP